MHTFRFALKPLLLFTLTTGLVASEAIYAASPRPVRAKNGVVVASESLAADIGLDILKKGGNAIDAAVAVGFALAVTYPLAGNIGGGGFMMLHTADGQTVAIDYREKAPDKATADMYLNADGTLKKDPSKRVGSYSEERANITGYLAVGVPGTVAGFTLALEKYGTLSLKEVLKPAIRLADKGFVISYEFALNLQRQTEAFAAYPSTRKIFLNNGKPFQQGDRLVQKDLAGTLRRIASKGRDGFYRGETARLIAQDMAANRGLITEEDLANYQARIRQPIRGTYRGYEIVSMPPPSSGGIALVEMLNILEGYDMEWLGHNSSRTLHLVIEAMRRAYADRARYLGDTDFVEVPVRRLISKEYAARLRATIDPFRATPSRELGPEPVFLNESENTTHFSVADRYGNVVSNTYTLERYYGAKVVAEGTGVLLNNEMGDFNARPGVTDTTGTIGTQPNLIEPNKRMLSSMTPTLVFKDGKPYMAVGSPGGRAIINTVVQVILNVIDHRMTIQEAVDAPRIHHQWFPDRVRIEAKGFPVDVIQALEAKGHRLQVRERQGQANSILIDPEDGMMYGGHDPRRWGKAVGF